jgi:hypothetical protein
MTTPSERIRAMVAEGRVDAAEGERLLLALATPGSSPTVASASGVRLLVDPFAKWGGGTAAAIGAVLALLGFALSRVGIRFDGFLDLHVGNAPPAMLVGLVDQLAAWPLGAATFWLVARVLAGPGRRFVDFLGAVGIARVPAVLFALPLHLLVPASLVGAGVPRMSPSLFVVIVLALVAIAWQIALLFFGYRSASGLRGPKLGFSLAFAIVVAEVISKVAISLVKP